MPLTGDRKREYDREWIAARRTEFFANKSCSSCGSKDDLQLDHIDRAEKVTHRIWSWSQERRSAEIEKCQVLCAACHKAKTKAENVIEYPCGTYGRYRKGCRCSSCKEAVRLWWREYRLARNAR